MTIKIDCYILLAPRDGDRRFGLKVSGEDGLYGPVNITVALREMTDGQVVRQAIKTVGDFVIRNEVSGHATVSFNIDDPPENFHGGQTVPHFDDGYDSDLAEVVSRLKEYFYNKRAVTFRRTPNGEAML